MTRQIITDQQRSRILELLAKGKTYGTIARVVGCNRQHVYRVNKAHKVKSGVVQQLAAADALATEVREAPDSLRTPGMYRALQAYDATRRCGRNG